MVYSQLNPMSYQHQPIEYLLQSLDSPEADIRAWASRQLRQYAAEIEQALLHLMALQQGYKSLEAAKLYWELFGMERCEVIIQLLPSKHPLLGHFAFDVLLQCPVDMQVEALLKALPYAIPTVQLRILQCLAKLEDKRIVPAIIAVLRASQSTSVQQMAMQSLGRIGDQRAAVFVMAFSNHDDPSVCQVARRTLLQLQRDEEQL